MCLIDFSLLFFICSFIYFVIQCLPNRNSDGSKVEILEKKEESRQGVSMASIEEQGDVVDYPDCPRSKTIKMALDNVSEAIYSSYIAVWLKAPGKITSQPLYGLVNNAVLDVYDNVQNKAGRINSCKIVLHITKALIKHLESFRKGTAIISKKREEEVTILRQQSRSLLTCLLPDSLRDSIYLMPFLTETVAVSVLETTYNYLANPSFINQLVVNQLDNKPKSLQAHSTPSDSDLETDSRRMLPEGAERGPEGSSYRSLTVPRDVSIESDTTDSSSGDTDSSDLQMSLYKSCCEHWADKDWTARAIKMEDNLFRITIKITNDGLDPVSWDTQRSTKDFAELCDILSRSSPDQFLTTPENEASSTNKKRNENPELLIPMLVNLVQKDHDEECTFFLSPFPYDEESKKLFFESDFEDELSNESSSHSGSLCCDGVSENVQSEFRALSHRKKDKKKTQPARSVENEENPSPVRSASHDNNQSQANLDYMRSNNPMNTSNDVVPHDTDSTKREKQKMEKKEAREVLLDLVKEVLKVGGQSKSINFIATKGLVPFLNVIRPSFVKNSVEKVLSLAEEMFSKEQIVCYLDFLSALIRAPEATPLPPLEPLRTKAAKLIDEQLKSLQKDHTLYKRIQKLMRLDVQKIYSGFQNIDANKETLLDLLKDLVKMIIDEPK